MEINRCTFDVSKTSTIYADEGNTDFLWNQYTNSGTIAHNHHCHSQSIFQGVHMWSHSPGTYFHISTGFCEIRRASVGFDELLVK